jgi:hypothetical protein
METTERRSSSEATKLVGCFQELNERLSAFERLSQLKRMVMEGKLKHDVFEEMYRINTEKLVDPRRRKGKKFELFEISVLDDFCVRHRTEHSTALDFSTLAQSKLKRGWLYFDRIVLKSASTFGQHKDVIILGQTQMDVQFHEDPNRVDLIFEKRQEQFLFESEVEKLMFVEALERALDTLARSSISKDEPVLLGRPARSSSQVRKDFDARKSACKLLEHHLSSSSVTISSSQSSDTLDAEEKDDDECHIKLTKSLSEIVVEKALASEVEEDENKFRISKSLSDVLLKKKFMIDSKSEKKIHSTTSLTEINVEQALAEQAVNIETRNGADLDGSYGKEKTHLISMLRQASSEVEEAKLNLESKRLIAEETRGYESEVKSTLDLLRMLEDNAIKKATQMRDEDFAATKHLSECVANEINALNALDPEDIASTATSVKGEEDDYMSNDLRILIGRQALPSQHPMTEHGRLRGVLVIARKNLAIARSRVQKTAELRKASENDRREARKAVSAQMSKYTAASKQVIRAEEDVLHAKSVLLRTEGRLAHYEHCLLILESHHGTPTRHVRTTVARAMEDSIIT